MDKIMAKIDPFKRYQKGLQMVDLFPDRRDGVCSCGCGRELTGRKTRWHSRKCMKFALSFFLIIKGDNYAIREALFNKDQGMCCECGVYSDNWQADHIIPVALGGGGCTIDNFQTLCPKCHSEKTASQASQYLNT